MQAPKQAVRRSARRIGVEQDASFEERRDIILREAAKAFNEQGVQNTSLDDLAARLGVTKPAIYHYVPSKNELIKQCLDMSMQDTMSLLDQVESREGTGLEKLIYGFECWAEYINTDFGSSMVLIQQNSLSEESQREYRKAQRAMLNRIEAVIEQGIADKSIRECNPAVIALGLMALFNSMVHWYRAEGPLSMPEVINQLVGMAARGIARD